MPNMATRKQFYSVPELAELLFVKDSKISAWIASGELMAFNAATSRIGKPRWRISAESFEAFQAARMAVPPKLVATRRARSSGTKPVREWIK